MRTFLLSVVFSTALALAASATASPQPPAPDGEYVIVEPTQNAVRRYVDEMAIAPRAENQLSRWDRRICPGIMGLRQRYAQFVIDRMAQRALQVDLDVDRPGCKPNILIIVARDPDAVARDLHDNHRSALGYYAGLQSNSLGRSALLNTFVNSDAPVRWWHISRTMSETGEELMMPAGSQGAGAGMGGHATNSMFALWASFPNASVAGHPSRLHRSTRQDFGQAFIIVDAGRLESIHYDFAALSDYLAMVALAQLDPDADTSTFPTILNLFDHPPSEVGRAAMTDWDLAYLHGLYDAERAAVSANAQEGDIARTMNRELTPH